MLGVVHATDLQDRKDANFRRTKVTFAKFSEILVPSLSAGHAQKWQKKERKKEAQNVKYLCLSATYSVQERKPILRMFPLVVFCGGTFEGNVFPLK